MKLKIIVDTVQKAGQGSSLTMLASTRVAAKIAVIAGKIVLGVGTWGWDSKPGFESHGIEPQLLIEFFVCMIGDCMLALQYQHGEGDAALLDNKA